MTELTPELLRTFVAKIIVYEKEVKYSKHAPQKIHICFRDFILNETDDMLLCGETTEKADSTILPTLRRARSRSLRSRAMLTKAQQPPHMLRSQKFVGAFHKISLSFLQNTRLRAFLPQKKRGASATGFTQKRHTLWNQYIRFWENLQMVVVCKNRLPSGGPEWTIFTMTPGRRSYFAYSSPMSQFSVRPGRIRVRNTKN